MFRAASLLSYLLLALSVTGSLGSPTASARRGIVTLPIKARNGIAAMMKRDTFDTLGLLLSHPNPTLTNGMFGFTAQIGIGSPATEYNLLIDTAHPNTWVGAGKAYSRTSTSVNKGTRVSVTYAQGSFSGTAFTDKVVLSSAYFVTGQLVDDASTSSGFSGFDGVLGLAPGQSNLPTVIDTLYSQSAIVTKEFGLALFPNFLGGSPVGEMTIGNVDDTQFTGSLEYTARLTTAPYNIAWAVTTSISYGGTQLVAAVASTIDSLSPFIFLPTAAYNSYVASTGATLDTATGLLKVPLAAGASMQNLNIQWGGAGGTYKLQPDAQVWPFYMNVAIGGDNEHYYLVVKDGGAAATLGLPFMQRYYLAFNDGASTVGVANTVYATDKISFPPTLLPGGVCNMLDPNYCPGDYYCDGPAGGSGVCRILPSVPAGGECSNGSQDYPCQNGYWCTEINATYWTCQVFVGAPT